MQIVCILPERLDGHNFRVFMKLQSLKFFLVPIFILFLITSETWLLGEGVTIAGLNVVPHRQSPNMRYRRAPDPDMGARVEIFLKNNSATPWRLRSHMKYDFDGQSPSELLASNQWAWHDTPEIRNALDFQLPPGALTVWTFNARGSQWGVGSTHQLTLKDPPEQKSISLHITDQKAWLSSGERGACAKSMSHFMADLVVGPIV